MSKISCSEMNVCALSVLWLSSLAELPRSPVQLDERIERGNYWHRFHSCVEKQRVAILICADAFFVNCSEFSGLRREFQPVWFLQYQFGRADPCPGPASALKEFFLGPKIFVRWPLKMNNLMNVPLCWIGSPINCVAINHSSPMFVCRSLWYD